MDKLDVFREDREDLRGLVGDGYLARMKWAADEIAKLRACLEHTRDEICEGPVDDTLWHTAVPACTTVDNITLTLGDGWTYDGWLQAKEEQG